VVTLLVRVAVADSFSCFIAVMIFVAFFGFLVDVTYGKILGAANIYYD
jgi:hypothetical protein